MIPQYSHTSTPHCNVIDSLDDIDFSGYSNSILFDRRLYTDSNQPVRHLIPEFIEDNMTQLGIDKGYKTEAKIMAANNIISNLIMASKINRPVAISRDSKHYSNSSFYGYDYHSHNTYKVILEKLYEYGLIEMKPGYYNISGKGLRSRISATDKLQYEIGESTYSHYEFHTSEYIDAKYVSEEENQFRRIKPNKGIILKDEHKHLTKYSVPRVPECIDDRMNVLYPNDEILIPIDLLCEEGNRRGGGSARSLHLWEFQDTHRPLTTNTHKNCSNSLLYMRLSGNLYRVFNNGSFKEGGRFYGADYQNIPKALRPHILLNGSSVVEYDYSGYHFHMMYNLIGKELPSDPYSILGLPKELRPLLKIVSNIIINATSLHSAAGAIRHHIFAIEPGCEDEEERRNLIELVKSLGLNEYNLISAFKERHQDIKDFFHSGEGVHLQFKDSQIAKRIRDHFASQDIPDLCMHDSFLVPVNYADELYYIMRQYYRDMFGHDCPVDKKWSLA